MYRSTGIVLLALALGHLGRPPGARGDTPFVRGDASDDGAVDITDAILGLEVLFLGQAAPSCLASLDANDDGRIDVADPMTALFHTFGGAPELLPQPYPNCGLDFTPDGLSCLGSLPCPECFTQSELDAIVTENFQEFVCLPAPVLETQLEGETIIVCPVGSSLCTDGTDGCSIRILELTATLDVPAQEVIVALRAEIASVIIEGPGLFGGRSECDLRIDVEGESSLPFFTTPIGNGLREVSSIGDPEIDPDATEFTFTANAPGFLCALILAAETQVEDAIIAELGPALDEAVAGITTELIGTALCQTR